MIKPTRTLPIIVAMSVSIEIWPGQRCRSRSKLTLAERGTSVQADLTYPISKLLGNNLDIYLHLQYVDTIAESLLDYTERNRAFRLGFALVR